MISGFDVGPFSLKFYGVVIALAIFTAWATSRRRAIKYKIQSERIDELLLVIVPAGVVGGRLYHVFSSWTYYGWHLPEIFAVWQGGLGIFGALIFGTAAVYFFAKRKGIDVVNLLDLLAPSVLLAQAIGRWGNFFNQEAFGPPTALPWGIYIDPANRPEVYFNQQYFHPTFLYEFLWDLVFALVVFKLAKKLKRGQAFALYLIFYSLGRLIVEPMRFDTWIVGGVKVAIVLSLVALAFGLSLFYELEKVT